MAEAEGIHERMRQDRPEIERLEMETKIIRDETRTLLVGLELETPAQQEQRHDRDIAARDRENLILHLENYLLRAERGLPLGSGEIVP